MTQCVEQYYECTTYIRHQKLIVNKRGSKTVITVAVWNLFLLLTQTSRMLFQSSTWIWLRLLYRPVWISPPRFLAECNKRQLTRVVLFCCILGCLLLLICIEFVYLYFPVLFCLPVSVKWLAAKTASEMTYIVSSGALNSAPSNQPTDSDCYH